MDLLTERKTYRIAKIILILLLLLGFMAFVSAIAKRSADSDSLKKTVSWKIYQVQTTDTRVYCLARGVAGGRFNLTELSMMIADKNNLQGNYDLYPGQKILLPVFD